MLANNFLVQEILRVVSTIEVKTKLTLEVCLEVEEFIFPKE